MQNKLYKIFIYLIVFKFIIGIISSFGYFTHPHIIRQIDTMSVGLNYWLRWSDGVSAPYFLHNLLPGSLGGGDTPGITPMEFPLLNLFIAPWFSVGHYWGFTLSSVMVLFLNFFLLFIHYKEWKKVSREFGMTALLMGVFGISGTYIIRVMPDFTSMIFVSIACAYNFQNKSRWASFCFLCIGLLMKPTSAISLAILFFRKKFFKDLFKKDIWWIFGGLLVGGLYYTKGISYLISVSDQSGYFKVAARSPIEGLTQSLNDFHRFPRLFLKNFFSAWVIVPITMMVFISRKKDHLKILFSILLQVLAIFMIDGSHAYNHDYYFIGCSFLVCLFVIKSISNKVNKYTLYTFCTLLVFFNLERAIYRLKPLWKNNLRSDAAQLLKQLPELNTTRSIRARSSNPPELGLLFGRFQGNSLSAKYLVQHISEKECTKLVRVSRNFRVCHYK
jgi:hypothetical protein